MKHKLKRGTLAANFVCNAMTGAIGDPGSGKLKIQANGVDNLNFDGGKNGTGCGAAGLATATNVS